MGLLPVGQEESHSLRLELREKSKDLELAHLKIRDLESRVKDLVNSSSLSIECEALKHKLKVSEEEKGCLASKLKEVIEINEKHISRHIRYVKMYLIDVLLLIFST